MALSSKLSSMSIWKAHGEQGAESDEQGALRWGVRLLRAFPNLNLVSLAAPPLGDPCAKRRERRIKPSPPLLQEEAKGEEKVVVGVDPVALAKHRGRQCASA